MASARIGGKQRAGFCFPVCYGKDKPTRDAMVNGDRPRADALGVEPPAHLDPARAFARAESLAREGRIAEAETLFRALLRIMPNHPAILGNLVATVKARGDLTEAENLLRQAIATAPGEPAFHNNLGNLLRAKGKLAEAETSYRQALALKENFPEAHYNLGVTLDDMKRTDEALAAFRRAVALNPSYAQALTCIGAIGYRNGRYENALIELDRAVAVKPDYFDAHYYRGCVLAVLRRFDEALESLARANALRPDNYEAILAKANALRDAGRNDDALAALWRLMEIQPARVATHDELNSLAWTFGRKDLFLKSFAYAREREGDNPELLLHEAAFRYRRNENEEAERLLNRAHDIVPERADVAGMLGRVLAQQKKFEESYPHFSAAVKADPQNMQHRQEFGFALLNDRQGKEALRVFEEARALQPADQLTLAVLALAYREVGDSKYSELVDFDKHVRVYEIELPQGYRDAKAFNQELAEELKRFHVSKVEPIDQSLRGGTQTMGDLFASTLPVIQLVRDGISEAVTRFIRAMPDDPNHPLFQRKNENFSYSGSWSCQLRSSGYHANHVHPKGWISSAYYVHLPDAIEDEAHRQGWLKFGESNLALGERDRPEQHVRPTVGRLVLFPSYYWHGTVPFTSKDDRLGVAFDVIPASNPSAT